MEFKLLMREIKNLIKKIKKVSNGQARIIELEDDMTVLKVQIKPNDGLYKGGTFIFKIVIDPYKFQLEAPIVQCLTPVYHPNIDTTEEEEDDNSNVCLNMLDDWRPSYGLDGLINGLLFFFYHPEIEDSLSPQIGPGLSEEEFAENVRLSLLGEPIDGYEYEPNFNSDSQNDVSEQKNEDNAEQFSEKLMPKIISSEAIAKEIPKDNVNSANSAASSKLHNAAIDDETKNVAQTDVTADSEAENLLAPEIGAEGGQIPDTKFCAYKSFDRSVPEAHFVIDICNNLLSHVFCCKSDKTKS